MASESRAIQAPRFRSLWLFSLGSPAFATDLPVKAPVPYLANTQAYDWTDWYVGVHAGVVRGSSNWSSSLLGPGAPSVSGSFDLPFHFEFMAGTGSYVAGIQGGYNYLFPSRLTLGVEADVSLPNSDVLVPYSVQGSQTIVSPFTGTVTYGEAVVYDGTFRARVGYAFDRLLLLLYGTGGLAFSFDQLTRTQDCARV